MSMRKLRTLCENCDASISDIVLAITSNVLFKYFRAKNDNSKALSILVPFTFRTIPRDHRKYSFENQFVGLTMYMKIHETF